MFSFFGSVRDDWDLVRDGLLPSIHRAFAGHAYEIILVDDGSLPPQLDIARGLGGGDIFIMLGQGGGGIEKCLNLALSKVKGQVLIPVAGDMRFRSSSFARLCKKKLGFPDKIQIVFGKTVHRDPSGQIYGTSGWAKNRGLQKQREATADMIQGKTRPSGCAVAFRASFLGRRRYEKKFGPFSDFVLNNEALFEGDSWFCPQIVSETLHRETSYSRKTNIGEFSGYLEEVMRSPLFAGRGFSGTEKNLFRLRETAEFHLHAAKPAQAGNSPAASSPHTFASLFHKVWAKMSPRPLGVLDSLAGLPEGTLRLHKISPLWTLPQSRAPRPAAATLPEDRHPHLVSEADCPRPDLWLAEFRDADVYGPSVGIVTAGRHLLAEVSVEWSRPPEEHGVMRRSFPLLPKKLAGLSLLLGSTGGDTYHHWMLDILPRIRCLRMAGLEPGDFDHVLVHHRNLPFQVESLEKLGIPREKIRPLSRRVRYRCELLVALSLPAPLGRATPENVEFLRSFFLGSFPKPAEDRLLIGREAGTSRQVKGWEEVGRFFQAHGFREVVPGRLPVREQARLFAGASWVVGAHGAALTNLAFCRPGTRVLEILGWDYVNPCYRDLSVAAGLRYHAVLGSPQTGESSAFALSLDDASQNIQIDTGKVERLVAASGFLEKPTETHR